MEGQIVDIEYDDETQEMVQIVEDVDDCYVIRTLEHVNYNQYKFSSFCIEVPKECICVFYDTTCLEDTGKYNKVGENIYEALDESDYDYDFDTGDEGSDSSDDSGSEVSLDDDY
jgi:hypothetical protein|uniref:Uncharacterized protein n=1 Tax=viral metagenome TaxID=1070528 RepID=A0A6C0CMN3_9ZZZZ|tara:strand:- start:1743 stop:2084 length:342 start_codon:yes stop_codon:yes gene_type:complete